MRFKNYEHFHQKSSTNQNDARRSLITFFHTIGWTMLKYMGIQNLNQIYHAVQELLAFSPKELDQPK